MGHQEQLPFGCSPEITSRVLGELLSMTRVNCCHVLCVGSGSKRILKEFPAIFSHISILILSIILTFRSSSHSMHFLCVLKNSTLYAALSDVLCNVEVTDLENIWILCKIVCRCSFPDYCNVVGNVGQCLRVGIIRQNARAESMFLFDHYIGSSDLSLQQIVADR